MPRPKNANAEETQKRILRAAIKVFSESGIRDASLKDIADDAGVSVSAVNHYYGNKQRLVTACVKQMYDAAGQLVPALSQGFSDGVAATIETIGRRVVEFARMHAAELRLLQRLLLEEGDVPTELRNDYRNVLAKALASALGYSEGRARANIFMCIAMVIRTVTTGQGELERMMEEQGALAIALADEYCVDNMMRVVLPAEMYIAHRRATNAPTTTATNN